MKGYIFDEMTCFFDSGGRNILRGGKQGGGGGEGAAGVSGEGSGDLGPPPDHPPIMVFINILQIICEQVVHSVSSPSFWCSSVMDSLYIR